MIKMEKIILLKLGGSLITDKTRPYTAKMDIVKSLAVQIKRAFDINPDLNLIIGNGSGSFAHYPAVKYEMRDGIKKDEQRMGFCLVQDAAAKLNRIIVDELLKAEVKAMSLNPSSMIVSHAGKIKRFFLEPITGLLKLGISPVLYGDIVLDEITGAKIYSTEQLLANIALNLKKNGFGIEKIVHNGITRGVLDSTGNPVPLITSKNFPRIKRFLNGTTGFDVTGGMLHKVKESLQLTKKGIKSLIINGVSQQSLLTKALIGKQVTGTLIQ